MEAIDPRSIPLTSLIALLHAPEWADQRAHGEGLEVRRFGREIGIIAVDDGDDLELNEDLNERTCVSLAGYSCFASEADARQWFDALIALSQERAKDRDDGDD